MADSDVYLNGTRIVSHADGYTPFLATLTQGLVRGSNLVTVRISGRENPDIPPFGGQIDYLTYAGIYRDAWLVLTGKTWIENLKVETPDPLNARKQVVVKYELSGVAHVNGTITCKILDAAGNRVAVKQQKTGGSEGRFEFQDLEGMELWEIGSPGALPRRVGTRM